MNRASIVAALTALAASLVSATPSASQPFPPDIVLHASDATAVQGTWRRVPDTTAASGVRLWHPDAGVPKIGTPSANPRDYFELSFRAEAGRAYRLWIRGRAENDFYGNDSVYVQFSGSVAAGDTPTPTYRINSTAATTVIVEDCSGCSLRGWGWQDNNYGGTVLGPVIRFAQSGAQTIRIQGREDGISIDQVVLSSAAYFNAPPGAVRDDATIHPKTDFSGDTTPSGITAFTAAAYFAAADVAAVKDINADGRPDIVAIYDNAPITLSTALNGGARTFPVAMSEELWGGPESIAAMEVADFDGDGRADLLFLDASYNRLSMLAGDGAGHFATTPRVTPFTEHVADFAVADFNRDNILDVVASEPERNAIAIHVGRGDGTFTFQSWVNAGTAPTRMATGDFNGDGLADAASLNGSQQSAYFSLGDGTGRFVRQASVATGPTPRALAVHDLNRDGFADIVVTNADGTVSVSMATSQGSFQQKRDFVTSAIPTARPVEDGLAIGDVNGDNHPDLVVNQFTGSISDGFDLHLSILFGDGAGGFGPPQEFDAWGDGPARIVDLDGDGRADIVAPASNNGTQVLWNDPAATNRPPVAAAGADATVQYTQQANFRLNAAASSDPDHHALVYEWRNSTGTLFSNGIAPHPFTSPREPGTYTFTLTVDDLHGGRTADSVTVVIQDDRSAAGNRAPIARPVASLEGTWPYDRQFQDMPDPHTYLFSDSSDPDGDTLTWEWRNASGAVVSTEEFYFPSPALPPGTHAFTLTVRDGRGGVSQASTTVTVTPFKEINISVGYKELIVGTDWEEIQSDVSSGPYVRDRNAGAPKVAAPLASPASYVEFTFPADPTQEYKLWVRLRADSNYWPNDSIWMQFTGAVDAAGNPVFRPGTNSGLAVNLEECSGCGISGWGWRDDAWGAQGVMSTTLLRFPEGGLQTIRIQTREDGVSVNQIVLSSEKYRTARPGAVKNDATRLSLTAFWGH